MLFLSPSHRYRIRDDVGCIYWIKKSDSKPYLHISHAQHIDKQRSFFAVAVVVVVYIVRFFIALFCAIQALASFSPLSKMQKRDRDGEKWREKDREENTTWKMSFWCAVCFAIALWHTVFVFRSSSLLIVMPLPILLPLFPSF